MPRRSVLTAAERDSLLALPEAKDELIRLFTFSETDLAIINQRRGRANRLGFAVHLCYMRFPGVVLNVDAPPLPPWGPFRKRIIKYAKAGRAGAEA